MWNWSFDHSTRTFVAQDFSTRLTPKEAEAFTYLVARAGTVVTKEELQHSVWGMVAGTRSETVPVTLRNIRSKIGDYCAIETIRNSGYRIPQAAKEQGLPGFDSPYFERPEAQAAILGLLEEGWHVVTLVGPGGMGKTRLSVRVAAQYSRSTVFLPFAGVTSKQEAVRALLLATDLQQGDLDSVAAALAGRQLLFVIDEAEGAIDAVNQCAEVLKGHQFLVTSRADLGRSDEAVFPVNGLPAPDGRRFVRRCLDATRWRDDVEDALVERLLALVEGSPLAIEVAAGRPFGVLSLVESLEAGSLTAPALVLAFERSVDQLSEDVLAVLVALVATRDGIPQTDVVSWLGPGTSDATLELARRSLLLRQDAGWRLSTPLRAFLAERHAGVVTSARASFEDWVRERFRRAAADVFREPAAVVKSVRRYLEQLLHIIESAPVEELGTWLWVLMLFSYLGGPFQFYAAGWRIALRRMPGAPELSILGLFIGQHIPEAQAIEALSKVPSSFKMRALFLLSHPWVPCDLRPWEHVDAVVEPALEPLRQVVAVRTANDPEGAARQLMDELREHVLLGALLRLFIAHQMQQRGAHIEAEGLLRALASEFEEARLVGLRLTVLSALAASVGANGDRVACIDAYHQFGRAALHAGLGGWAVGRTGLWLLVLGEPAMAVPYLAVGVRDPSPLMRAVVQRLACIAARQQGEQTPWPELPPVDPGLVMVDGTSLATLVEAMQQVETLRLEGRVVDAQHVVRQTALADNTLAIRFWVASEAGRL